MLEILVLDTFHFRNETKTKVLQYEVFFLAPLAIGQQAYVMLLCVFVCVSVHICVNFFFEHLLWNYLLDFDEISQKCSCHGPLQKFYLGLYRENFHILPVRSHEA